MNGSREIEKKFRIPNGDLYLFSRALGSILKNAYKSSLIDCYTKDLYFKAPKGTDIVRLRDSWGMSNTGFNHSLKELTVKIKDHKTNFDRQEENVKLQDTESALKALTAMFGKPILELKKQEYIIWTKDNVCISLAKVTKSLWNSELFLEVEGPNKKLVRKYCKLLKAEFNLKAEPRSLLEIFG